MTKLPSCSTVSGRHSIEGDVTVPNPSRHTEMGYQQRFLIGSVLVGATMLRDHVRVPVYTRAKLLCQNRPMKHSDVRGSFARLQGPHCAPWVQ